MLPRIGLFIPCYNVEPNLADTLSSLSKEVLDKVHTIYLVDNQSQDKSLDIALEWAKNQPGGKVKVFLNQSNHSLGGSTIVAFREALKDGTQWLVCMHSDGQAKARDLSRILEVVEESPDLDLVSGSRFLKHSQVDEYSTLRKWANLFFCYLQQPLLKQKVFDIGAFLAFNLERLKSQPFDRVPHDMGFHPLLILTWARCQSQPLRIREIPIQWGQVESSNVRIWSYGLTHLLRIFKLYLRLPLLLNAAPELKTKKIFPEDLGATLSHQKLPT